MADHSKLADTLNEWPYLSTTELRGTRPPLRKPRTRKTRRTTRSLVQQSEQFVKEINGFARAAGGDAESSTTLKGKFYRGFMDAKAVVTGRDEKSILDSNIYGEEWAIKAYTEALADPALTGPARQAVERQHQASQQTLRKLEQLKGIAGVR
ncbi:DUF2383 domain-containing protein [Hymenobacter humi]|uniref:DUF2383 domain-containing protein n=1 Tax=Hymenobacter humi TaxID=1411620 RepID=A0ABW2TYZ0_9BACT